MRKTNSCIHVCMLGVGHWDHKELVSDTEEDAFKYMLQASPWNIAFDNKHQKDTSKVM